MKYVGWALKLTTFTTALGVGVYFDDWGVAVGYVAGMLYMVGSMLVSVQDT